MERSLHINAVSWGKMSGGGCGDILGSTVLQKIFVNIEHTTLVTLFLAWCRLCGKRSPKTRHPGNLVLFIGQVLL